MQPAAARPILIDALLPAAGLPVWVRNGLLVAGGSLLLTLSAKINVPFYPVPMTMQTFAVILIGAAFGWRLGTATVLFYLAQGAMGLPVFAGTPEKGIGLAYMAGPTGGYLLGFAARAFVTGWLANAASTARSCA
jgi:biotin transport system substrate-specific component